MQKAACDLTAKLLKALFIWEFHKTIPRMDPYRPHIIGTRIMLQNRSPKLPQV